MWSSKAPMQNIRDSLGSGIDRDSNVQYTSLNRASFGLLMIIFVAVCRTHLKPMRIGRKSPAETDGITT